MNKIKLTKIILEDKLYNQITESSLNKDKNIEIKKPYSPPKTNQLRVSTTTASGSSPSDFDAFNTSS